MILAAEYIPSPLRLMLGLTRESGIGSPESAPIPDFLPGIGEGIPDSRFGRESGNPPIPDSGGNRESGSRFAGPGISWSARAPRTAPGRDVTEATRGPSRESTQWMKCNDVC